MLSVAKEPDRKKKLVRQDQSPIKLVGPYTYVNKVKESDYRFSKYNEMITRIKNK